MKNLLRRLTNPGGLNVSSLEEIRTQAAPEVIEIPGFKPGTMLRVAVIAPDFMVLMMAMRGSNALMAAVQQKIRAGKGRAEIAQEVAAEAEAEGGKLESIMVHVDTVVKAALVSPTWDEITAIRPLTLEQRMAIFDHVWGTEGVGALASFRSD